MKTRKAKNYNNKTKKYVTCLSYKKPPEQITIEGYTFLFLPIRNGTFQMNCQVFGGGYLEEKHNSGISHLLEHIITDSWKKCYKKGCVFYLEKYGTKSNAHTTMNDTNYWMSGISKYTDVIMEYIISISLDPHITKNTLTREIEAVRNEITNLKNNPNYKLQKEIAKVLFKNKGLVYFADYDVQLKNLKSLTTNDLLQFAQKIISTKRIMFVVSGDYQKNKVIQKAKQIICGLPKRSSIVKIPNCDFNTCYCIEKRVVFIKNDHNSNSVINIIFPIPLYQGNKNITVLPLLTDLLGKGLNSLLLKKLRIKEKLVYSVNVTSTTNFCGTAISIKISTINKNLKEVLHETFGVINKYKTSLVPEDTLKHYKTKFLLNLRSECLNNTYSLNKFYTHQYFYQLEKNNPIIYTLNKVNTIVKSITRENIRKLLNELLRTETCSVFYMSNKKICFNVNDF